jgi:hypothetical protein
MSLQAKKKSLREATTEVLRDLRTLKNQGLTLPDVLYHYKVQNGRPVRRRPRRGSFSEEEESLLEGREMKSRY